MTVNDFIKNIKELFGDVEYKATSIDGKVCKTKGYDENNSQNNKRQKFGSDKCYW
jgi:hypothetical protein